MTDKQATLSVETDRHDVIELLFELDSHKDSIHHNELSYRYGFSYNINFISDSIEEIRIKSHLCRRNRRAIDD